MLALTQASASATSLTGSSTDQNEGPVHRPLRQPIPGATHERFIAALFGVFSFVALGLAAIGLASVVAYSVEQRTREFGIRTALGAPRWNVLVLTLIATARTTGLGLVLGILLSIALNDAVHRWTESNLRDPAVLSVIAAVFLCASAVACLLPARRAMRIDPMVALRDS